MKKRKSYKFENVIEIKSNISNINPYISYHKDDITNKLSEFSFESYLTKYINKEVIKLCSSYVENCGTFNSKRLAFRNLNMFLSYIIELEHENLNKIDYSFLYDYRIYLHNKYKKTLTVNRYYQLIISFLKFVILDEYQEIHEDVKNLDIPKSLKKSTKSATEKDLEHYNKSFNFKEYSILINGMQDVITNKTTTKNDKIVAFSALLGCYTGANPEVLLAFNFKDLQLMRKDFKTMDIVKQKNKKGMGCDIKVILKNYECKDTKLSECAEIIYNIIYDDDRIEENDLIFKVYRDNGLYFISGDNNRLVRNLIKKYKIDFNSNFTFSGIRKTYERHIYKITDNLLITSTLMGHTKEVASKNYLNTAASLESHQKLALTQDVIEGFSKNKETDDFVVYQKLLNLFDIDLETALQLSNDGLSIDDIISKAKRNKNVEIN